jgi:hypothetical protein
MHEKNFRNWKKVDTPSKAEVYPSTTVPAPPTQQVTEIAAAIGNAALQSAGVTIEK